MYNIIQHSHSGIMWLAVAMLVISALLSLLTFIKNDENDSFKWFKLFKFTKWVLYIQALLGIVLLFISEKVYFGEGFMKSKDLRFYGLEHPLMMLAAVGLIAIGLFKLKNKATVKQKNKTVFIYFSIAIIIVFFMIPWKTVLAQNTNEILSNTEQNGDIVKTDTVKLKGPAIVFETIFKDLGEVVQTSHLVYEYEFTNTGNEALIITNVRTSCSCSVASYTKTPIAKGESDKINVKLDTKILGQFNKTIAVYSNAINHFADDIGQSRIILKIKWTVVENNLENPGNTD